MSEDLSSFFNLVAEEKRKKDEEFKSIIGDLNFDDIFEEVSNPNKNKKKVKKVVIEEQKEEQSLIERSLGLLAQPSDQKIQQDPLTPLTQNFATLEDLQNHYRLFLERIQQQLSTLGGSGEVRLEFLDDVDRDSAKRDNYFLKYDATINKWVGDDGGGVGITSIVFITGVTTYYSATRDVDYIGVSADVPVTIDLPTNAAPGKQIIIKDEGNKISTYNITVRAGIGASVENDTSVLMKINHESFTYFYNGYNWYIV
jgi:hypothetical protein